MRKTRSGAEPASGCLNYVTALRQELSERNVQYAQCHGLDHTLSLGELPAVCFTASSDLSLHGNFFPATYRAIRKNHDWFHRLSKHHAQAKRAIPRKESGSWKELDSGNSSDALLMNIFCNPAMLRDRRFRDFLGVDEDCRPEFGVKARVPLVHGGFDRTEVDMRLGTLLIEAKLTESDFQRRPMLALMGYRDFTAVFDVEQLPRMGDICLSDQLIRNVLAAHALNAAFCVLLDSRRPDLIHAWYRIVRCVRIHDLRLRCKLLTWQEVSSFAKGKLRDFLEQKYGICPDNPS